ncbi:glycerophosphodiester phosphodiesterase, partial [Aduncisulcus paluster]
MNISDLLVSSFNWEELKSLRETGPEAEKYFAELFAYGNEDYMLPRFPDLTENLVLLDKICEDQKIHSLLKQELKDCLNGRYYTDELLDNATAMNATSVNLWYRTIVPEFIEKAHARNLAVFVYTANQPEEWKALAEAGVDGIFTD